MTAAPHLGADLLHHGWREARELLQDKLEVLWLVQQRDAQRHVEGAQQLRLLQEVLIGRCADDEQPAPSLRWLLFQQTEERLEYGVREPRSDAHIVHQTFEVIQHNDGERTFVGILEDLRDGRNLRPFRVAHVVLMRHTPHKRIVGPLCEVCGKRSLATAWRPVQQRSQERRIVRVLNLLHQVGALLLDMLELRRERRDSMPDTCLEVIGVLSEGRLHLEQGSIEVLIGDADAAHVLGRGQFYEVDLAVQGKRRGRADKACKLSA
mmetsp:Transcript_90183/g.232805  ORF Transcript_90183/g.232805 Transcript_90183/m.232805 type:complete len:265 (+) Transcript_90183:348-1142(+)